MKFTPLFINEKCVLNLNMNGIRRWKNYHVCKWGGGGVGGGGGGGGGSNVVK